MATKNRTTRVRDALASVVAKAVEEGLIQGTATAVEVARGMHLKRGLVKSVARKSTEGEMRRDDGIARAESHADPAWLRAAAALVMRLARQKAFFTTADIWEAGLAMPHEPRALGPVMMNAERDGIIVATNEYRKSPRASRHCAPALVWRSLLISIKGAA